MANRFDDSVSPLQQLPAEILFRIFNDLDTVTLLLSLGQTCRRLRTLVHSYDRVSLDFTLVSKPQFHCLLNVIDPHNVTSLELTDQAETPDVVNMFCSHDFKRPFDRLRSLTLLKITERDLRNILQRVEPASLTSFTLKTSYADFPPTRTTGDAISSLITHSHLSQLETQIKNVHYQSIIWPETNTIKQLKLRAHFRVNDLRRILDNLPLLKILSVENIITGLEWEELKVKAPIEPFRQLTLLTISSLTHSMDDLTYVLSMTPSLVHLQLVGRRAYGDGKRWEQFIQLNLPHLEKFEFFFEINLDKSATSNIESIGSSFQTPFWLEQKKWIVQEAVSYRLSNPSCLNVYSLPICTVRYTCETEAQKNTIFRNYVDNPSWMDNVTTLKWYVNQSVSNADEEKVMIQDESDVSAVTVVLSFCFR